MVSRYRGDAVPAASVDERFAALERSVTAEADEAIERFAINEAIATIWTLVDELNGYITDTEPWQLAKDDAKAGELDAVLATAVHVLGTLSVLLSPVMPKATAKLWAAIGGEGDVRDQDVCAAWQWTGSGRITPLDGTLFPRIEEPVTA